MKPIPLTDPKGRVYTYACGACHHVADAGEPVEKMTPGAVKRLAASILADAERCCVCPKCGKNPIDRWDGACDGCTSASMAAEVNRVVLPASYVPCKHADDPKDCPDCEMDRLRELVAAVRGLGPLQHDGVLLGGERVCQSDCRACRVLAAMPNA